MSLKGCVANDAAMILKTYTQKKFDRQGEKILAFLCLAVFSRIYNIQIQPMYLSMDG